MLADELNNVIHGRTGLEDSRHADFLETFDILIGDDAANQHQHVVHFVLLQQIHHPRNDGVVRPRENREPDDLHVFLQRGTDDHLRRLAQTGVDDLHAGIAKGAGDHLSPAIVAVETGLRNENADFLLSGHRDHLTTEGAGSTASELGRRGRPSLRDHGFTPNCQNRNEYMSVFSSICLVTGLPCPWPALVSMRSRIGFCWLAPFLASDCMSAAIFLACMGSTRVSVSPVIKRIAGYS